MLIWGVVGGGGGGGGGGVVWGVGGGGGWGGGGGFVLVGGGGGGGEMRKGGAVARDRSEGEVLRLPSEKGFSKKSLRRGNFHCKNEVGKREKIFKN